GHSRRRRLRRRSGEEPVREAVRDAIVSRRTDPRSQGDGRDGHLAVARERPADHRLRRDSAGGLAPHRRGRTGGDPGRKGVVLMKAEELVREAEEHMNKSIEAARREFAGVRTGKATTALLDGVRVEYYGTPTPLRQVANLSAPEARLLTVQPFDKSTGP